MKTYKRHRELLYLLLVKQAYVCKNYIVGYYSKKGLGAGMGFLGNHPMQSRIVKYGLILIVVTLGIILAASAAKGKETQQTSGTPDAPGVTATPTKAVNNVIRLVNGSWDSICFNNALAKIIIEVGYQYKTSLEESQLDGVEGMLAKDKADVDMEYWLYDDVISEYLSQISSGNILQAGINYDDSVQGVFVPDYVVNGDSKAGIAPMTPGLSRLQDLKNFWHVFKDGSQSLKGKFYGSVNKWDSTNIKIKDKFEAYGLSNMFELVTSKDEKELTDSLVEAISKHEPWVGYYWQPSWVFGAFKLVRLEEPKYNSKVEKTTGLCETPTVPVVIISSGSFAKKAPNVYVFLSKYHTGSQLLSDMLAYRVEKRLSFTETALWFLKTKRDMWKEWVSQDAAARLDIYLRAISKTP